MNLIRKYRHVIITMAACYLFLPTILYAETASFDALDEGMTGN